MNSIRAHVVTLAVAALTVVLAGALPAQAAASHSQAAGLKNCGDNGIIAPCFEMVWSDGVQRKMTFLDFNPKPSNDPTTNFYVMAPQTAPPQGWVPFLHDHVIGDAPRQNSESRDGDGRVRYHAFFVLCSAQGIASGGCVPAMTPIPGLGTVPFARTVNGQLLTSVEPIESPATSGLLTLIDTGGVLIASVRSGQKGR